MWCKTTGTTPHLVVACPPGAPHRWREKAARPNPLDGAPNKESTVKKRKTAKLGYPHRSVKKRASASTHAEHSEWSTRMQLRVIARDLLPKAAQQARKGKTRLLAVLSNILLRTELSEPKNPADVEQFAEEGQRKQQRHAQESSHEKQFNDWAAATMARGQAKS